MGGMVWPMAKTPLLYIQDNCREKCCVSNITLNLKREIANYLYLTQICKQARVLIVWMVLASSGEDNN